MSDMPHKITRPYQRRRYLVDRTFQLRFLFLFLGGVLVIVILSGGTTYGVLHSILTRWLYSSHLYHQRSGEFFGPALLWINMGLSIGLTVLAVVSSVMFLRRVARSLQRFAIHLGGMSQGKIPPAIHFRKNDSLHETAEEFNSMVMALTEKRTTIFEQLTEAKSLVNEVLEQQSRDPEQAKETLDRAAARIQTALKGLEGSVK
ncbi:MAG: methyl-accepting chemotaxis protein [Deltaproteobacteria bacterium]|nr:methyl-accepting chemotaxis protein [Deltaproteobacteria bacterium]